MTIVIFKVLVVLFLNDSRLCNRTLDVELKPIIHTYNFEVKSMRNSLIACSHQTPDLSPNPVHSVFAFGLAAPLHVLSQQQPHVSIVTEFPSFHVTTTSYTAFGAWLCDSRWEAPYLSRQYMYQIAPLWHRFDFIYFVKRPLILCVPIRRIIA